MQYLIVRCNRTRRVLIGGIDHGGTGECIELPASGFYTITVALEPGDACSPPSHRVNLVGTDPVSPHEVRFDLA